MNQLAQIENRGEKKAEKVAAQKGRKAKAGNGQQNRQDGNGIGKQLMQKFWNYKWVSLPTMKRGYTWLCVPISAVSMMIFSGESIIKQVWALVKGGKA